MSRSVEFNLGTMNTADLATAAHYQGMGDLHYAWRDKHEQQAHHSSGREESRHRGLSNENHDQAWANYNFVKTSLAGGRKAPAEKLTGDRTVYRSGYARGRIHTAEDTGRTTTFRDAARYQNRPSSRGVEDD
jgi:hypothetical protein